MTKPEYFVSFLPPHTVVRWHRDTQQVEQYLEGAWVPRNIADWIDDFMGYDSIMRQVPAPENEEQLRELRAMGRKAPWLPKTPAIGEV